MGDIKKPLPAKLRITCEGNHIIKLENRKEIIILARGF
ncbi:hypothetical protein LEP1GSC050_4331 [Leptospira broomii serovar Hurstbridge str. 5399]|uniref:Uncharacterized protein n=1 Tax=Leptospira broomii serovar Hurstbridge str. 5399 TaxID=1049789 RepID=T0GGC9_9LEPT|nr:hypothetical protein LEP1GSC050_4331 [Leptospira broomii serovar Hurstbridge str. 5399]